MKRTILLQNVSRREAYAKFEETKSLISDFNKESVRLGGNIRNEKEGWSVIKIDF